MQLRELKADGFEEVWEAEDTTRKLHAFIAIHSLKRGPAIGGVRLRTYKNDEQAIDEVKGLARGMSYKAAVAELAHGGGKGVIMQPRGDFDRVALYEAFADFVNHLNGRYITATDAGTTSADVAVMKARSSWVGGAPVEAGGPGDPSPVTAAGVHAGMKACVQEKFKTKDLKGLRIIVQGLGSVGSLLARRLLEDACEVWGGDVRPQALFHMSSLPHFHALLPEMVFDHDGDIFAPCALGGTITQESISQLKVSIIAGSANEQLQDPEKNAQALHERGILYAPDFVVNAGGLIHIACELAHESEERAKQKTEQIAETLSTIFERSRQSGKNPYQVAISLAQERMR